VKALVTIAAVLLFALIPTIRRRATPARRMRLQLCDFKDRRNAEQRHSYGAITAARQAFLDHEQLEEWRRRVRANEVRRIARSLSDVHPISARVAGVSW
jgi:hypothetical protein